MKILLIGSGAREHAIAHRIRRENPKAELLAIPGNPGLTELSVRCLIDERMDSIESLRAIALKERPDFVVVGPELPLSLGVIDMLRAEGIAAVGPTAAAARLESSKSFAKSVMQAANIATARSCLTKNSKELDSALAEFGLPVVLKADGLAAGKGVVVCHTAEELGHARIFFSAELKATEILVEEFLAGVEATLMIATNGTRVVLLPTAHDYKRALDGDLGANTGGMGSVSPTPRLTPEQIFWCVVNIIDPLLAEMRARGTPFTGFLYAGLMISPSGKISVIEFNARLGDPETQSALAMLNGSFTEGLRWMAQLTNEAPIWGTDSGCAVSVVAASAGYPGAALNTDCEIDGILLALNLPNVAVYQAGTRLEARKLLTAGGRVLTVTAKANSGSEAVRLAYRALDVIQFKGRMARRDIGREII